MGRTALLITVYCVNMPNPRLISRFDNVPYNYSEKKCLFAKLQLIEQSYVSLWL